MEGWQAVEQFIAQQAIPQRDLLLALHQLLLTYPNIKPKIRYRIPFYDQNKWICYLNPLKNGGVELAFVRANEMPEIADLLNRKSRSQIAGIDIVELNENVIRTIDLALQCALQLDSTTAVKKKK
jgi:hypothetical protein